MVINPNYNKAVLIIKGMLIHSNQQMLITVKIIIITMIIKKLIKITTIINMNNYK